MLPSAGVPLLRSVRRKSPTPVGTGRADRPTWRPVLVRARTRTSAADHPEEPRTGAGHVRVRARRDPGDAAAGRDARAETRQAQEPVAGRLLHGVHGAAGR